jgi:hypothetical protein
MKSKNPIPTGEFDPFPKANINVPMLKIKSCKENNMKQTIIEEQWEYDNVKQFHDHQEEMTDRNMYCVSHKVIAIYRLKTE